MTALFEMHIQVGGDPRHCPAFTALHSEMAKLGHPARPDVDWAKVEQGCLALFKEHGVELNSACFYTLARGQRYGPEGVLQGVVLITALSAEWSRVWPPLATVRVGLLEWLFEHLHLLLRSQAAASPGLAVLVQLDAELARLQACLSPQLSAPLVKLAALRQHISQISQRLEQPAVPGEIPLAPVVVLPPPALVTRRSRRGLWLCAAALAIAMGAAWQLWRTPAQTETPLPEPIRLDSLALFEGGSATLKPGSTKLLVNALVGIKARPGWLIVIAGHTDASGALEHNLALSHARATAVRDWMQRMGDLADSCFAVQGLAASQPLASNQTEAGRAANRRVDIQLVPQLGACE
jgi:type VI secretion system protein VasL